MSKRNRARQFASVIEAARQSGGDTGDGGLAVLTEQGELIHFAPKNVTSSLRYLLARLTSTDGGGVPRRIALTSALSGEGVTFVSRSLAAVLANDLDKRVCLVELNWWSSSSKQQEEAQEQPGLADVLSMGTHLDDAIVRTTSHRLSILPAGFAPVSKRPVLAKAGALDEVLDQLSARFDHVVLDLPAIGSTGDAISLVRLADAVALVVHQGITTEGEVRQAMEELGGVPTLGVILNRNSTSIPRRLRRILSSM